MHAILVVEGPTDEAVVGRALKLLGLERFGGDRKQLDPFWEPIILNYPPRSGNLYQRISMPSILRSNAVSVAVYAGGGSRLVAQVKELLGNHDLHRTLGAFGIVADADAHPPAEVAKKYQAQVQDLFAAFPGEAAVVVPGPPALGMVVLPDGVRHGVVEHLVIQCGEVVYPTLMARARAYVDGFTEPERAQARWAPFDPEKALVAAVASFLKPGMTNKVSVDANDWIGEQTRHCAMLAALLSFLESLLGLRAPAAAAGTSSALTP